MGTKYYKCYNANAIIKMDLDEKFTEETKQTDSVIRYLNELKPEIKNDYILALEKRLTKEVNDYHLDSKIFDLKAITNQLSFLNENNPIVDLIIRFICKYFALQEDYKPDKQKIEVTNLNRAKAFERLSYYRVKAFTDILGKDEGIKLYTKILGLIVNERNSKMKVDEKRTVKSDNEGSIKGWCRDGVGDFIFTFIDDNQIIYRFDKCVTHEALKDLNDPDVAYVASCFIGDIPEWNEGEIIHLRRTQTLHHGDFCDELYWDTRVWDKPKEPTLEFIRNLGKKKV